jgi:hypothetical protein
VNRRLGGTYRLHLQGRRISRARNQQKAEPWRDIPESYITLHISRMFKFKISDMLHITFPFKQTGI